MLLVIALTLQIERRRLTRVDEALRLIAQQSGLGREESPSAEVDLKECLCPLYHWKLFGMVFSIQCVMPATATIRRESLAQHM
jgi:hypothetical protein